MARVDQAFVRPAHVVDAGTDIVSVVRLFQQERTTNVLVQDGRQQPPRLGIFTTNALQRAILSGRPLDQIPVGRAEQLFAHHRAARRPGGRCAGHHAAPPHPPRGGGRWRT
jgi:CBS domain-containing protein